MWGAGGRTDGEEVVVLAYTGTSPGGIVVMAVLLASCNGDAKDDDPCNANVRASFDSAKVADCTWSLVVASSRCVCVDRAYCTDTGFDACGDVDGHCFGGNCWACSKSCLGGAI